MDTSKFDEKIKKLNSQMDSLRRGMKVKFENFLDVTKEFSAEWARNKVESAIRSHAERAIKYGGERLGKLKAELEELIGNMPRIVDKHLIADKYWVHRRELVDGFPNNIGRYEVSGKTLPGDLDAAQREVFGYVGCLLIKYHFATEEDSDWEIEPRAQIYKYRGVYDCSDEMRAILGRYSEKYKEFIELRRELNQTEREKKEAVAMDLYGNA